MKKHILITGTVVTICLVSFFLFVRIKTDQSKNSFKRNIVELNIGKPYVFELPDHSFNFIGKPKEDVSLYSHQHPMIVYKIKDFVKSIESTYLNTAPSFNTKSYYIIMRSGPSSKIYLSNSEGSLEIIGDSHAQSYKIPLKLADNCTPISNSSVVVRSIEKKGKERIMSLVKVTLTSKPKEVKKYIIPKHGDGLFGNDGILRFDKKTLKFIYTYFYFGEFLCLDTNLNLMYKGKTIDTVTAPQLKLGLIKTTLKNGSPINGITQISPSKFINLDFSINNGFLYIISRLRADNESYSNFNDNQPIDVYSLENGRYLHTFYIPKFRKFELKKLEVTDNHLLAIFDKYLIKYHLE